MKTIYYFPILALITIVFSLLSNYILDIDTLMFNSLSEQLTKEQVVDVFNFNQKWKWLAYIFIPLILLVKIVLISGVLWIGIYFFDKEITYKKLFTLVTKTEFVFIIVVVLKIVWFVFQEDYTLQDVQSFYPLSALSIVGYDGLSPWFVYPFQILNLFELIYWFVLAWLLSKELKSSTDNALKIVASSYGSALLIWVVTVMFFTLNVS